MSYSRTTPDCWSIVLCRLLVEETVWGFHRGDDDDYCFSGIWQIMLSQICNDVSEKLMTVLWNVRTYLTRLHRVEEKGKVPITLVHVINVREVEENPPILTLVLGRGEWTASRPGDFILSTHWTRCCLGLRAGLHVLEERKSFAFAENRTRFLGLPARNLVTVLTEPPQLP